jgi:hypothetical protein
MDAGEPGSEYPCVRPGIRNRALDITNWALLSKTGLRVSETGLWISQTGLCYQKPGSGYQKPGCFLLSFIYVLPAHEEPYTRSKVTRLPDQRKLRTYLYCEFQMRSVWKRNSKETSRFLLTVLSSAFEMHLWHLLHPEAVMLFEACALLDKHAQKNMG